MDRYAHFSPATDTTEIASLYRGPLFFNTETIELHLLDLHPAQPPAPPRLPRRLRLRNAVRALGTFAAIVVALLALSAQPAQARPGEPGDRSYTGPAYGHSEWFAGRHATGCIGVGVFTLKACK